MSDNHDERELKAAVHELEDRFITCRDLGHAWRRQGDLKPGEHGLVLRVLRCMVCKTERHDWITRTSGTVYGRRYSYPEGYQLSGYGRAFHTRSRFRLEMLERAGLNGR